MIAKPIEGRIPIKVLNTKDDDITFNFSNLDIHDLNTYNICCFTEKNNSTQRIKTLFDLLDLNYLNMEEKIGIENICAKYFHAYIFIYRAID